MTRKKQQKQLAVLATVALITGVFLLHYGRGTRLASGFAEKGEDTPIPVPVYGRGDLFHFWPDAQKAEYIAGGRNIFVIGRIPAEGKKKHAKDNHFSPVGPVQPVVEKPVLPMVFFGYGVLPVGGPRQGFLKDNDSADVHIVSEGDLLPNHFLILHILDFEDINTGLKGSTTLEAPPAV